jgi:hypothetical protein
MNEKKLSIKSREPEQGFDVPDKEYINQLQASWHKLSNRERERLTSIAFSVSKNTNSTTRTNDAFEDMASGKHETGADTIENRPL